MFPYHSAFSDNLFTITDFFNLELLFSTNYISTRYLDSNIRANSVIDLMFLQSGLMEINNYSILSDLWLSSDHAPLLVTITIEEENINSFKFSIAKNSKEEKKFIKDILFAIKNIDISDLSDFSKIEDITNPFTSKVKFVWKSNAKWVWITKHSKSWWNNECNCALTNYRSSRSLENWKIFKRTVKPTKQTFFDHKIQEIANKKYRP